MRKSEKVIAIGLFTLWIIALIFFTVNTAAATECEPSTDYMAQMMATTVLGDAECGRQLAEARNAKIDAQGFTYQKIAWDDLYLLNKIIYAEAGSYWLSDEWKMSV